MKGYNSSKAYDAVTGKNVEENEERDEIRTNGYFNTEYLNIKNIHSKGKEYR